MTLMRCVEIFGPILKLILKQSMPFARSSLWSYVLMWFWRRFTAIVVTCLLTCRDVCVLNEQFHDSCKSLCDWLDTQQQKLRQSTTNTAKMKQELDELQVCIVSNDAGFSLTAVSKSAGFSMHISLVHEGSLSHVCFLAALNWTALLRWTLWTWRSCWKRVFEL